MDPSLVVVIAGLAAAVLGWFGPAAIARLPEPAPDPEDDEVKPLYVDIAAAPRLAPWLAAGSALLAVVAGLSLAEPWLVPAWVVLAAVGSWLTYIDWRTRLLPFRMTVPLHVACLVLVALAALVTGDWSILVKGLIGNVVVFAIFLLINLLGRFVSQPFGYGDVRLSAILGLTLGAVGYQATLFGLYIGFVLGAVCGLVLSRRGIVDAKGFAFGPYLVVGAFLGLGLAAAF